MLVSCFLVISSVFLVWMESRLNVIQSQVSAVKPNLSVMAKHSDPISSHVLDTSSGFPASGISITFEKFDSQKKQWVHVIRKEADKDGRASKFLSWEEFQPITYRMRFDIKDYFHSRGVETFYPYAEVVFEISDVKAHYHVPLLLSPYGYSTYRGS